VQIDQEKLLLEITKHLDELYPKNKQTMDSKFTIDENATA
jgi:hypothetical protein